MDEHNKVRVSARILEFTLEEEMQQLKDMFAEVRVEVNGMVHRLTTNMTSISTRIEVVEHAL